MCMRVNKTLGMVTSFWNKNRDLAHHNHEQNQMETEATKKKKKRTDKGWMKPKNEIQVNWRDSEEHLDSWRSWLVDSRDRLDGNRWKPYEGDATYTTRKSKTKNNVGNTNHGNLFAFLSGHLFWWRILSPKVGFLCHMSLFNGFTFDLIHVCLLGLFFCLYLLVVSHLTFHWL